MSSETNTPNIDSVTAWLAKRLSEKHDTATTVSMFRRKLTDLLEKRERELAAARAVIEKMRAALRFTQSYLVPANLNEEEIMSLTDAALAEKEPISKDPATQIQVARIIAEKSQ